LSAVLSDSLTCCHSGELKGIEACGVEGAAVLIKLHSSSSSSSSSRSSKSSSEAQLMHMQHSHHRLELTMCRLLFMRTRLRR
jgi:hypothetical protein